jgi:hypothetical protein
MSTVPGKMGTNIPTRPITMKATANPKANASRNRAKKITLHEIIDVV